MSEKITIKHRYSGAVLFECEAPEGLASGMRMRHALEQATAARANLRGANLDGAYLGGANLDGAYLRGAYLRGANLRGAYLDGANLDGANLDGAYLRGAYLRGANLGGAYLDGANLDGANLGGAYLGGAHLGGDAKLIGERPVFIVGPIGSRCAYFTAYITDKGLRLRAGCFFGTRDEFVAKLDAEHGDNRHGGEYRAALALMDAHATFWTPGKQEAGNLASEPQSDVAAAAGGLTQAAIER